MRRWVAAVTVMILMPWIVSLVWMRAAGVGAGAGQAGKETGKRAEETEYGETENHGSGEKDKENENVEAAAEPGQGIAGEGVRGSVWVKEGKEAILRKILVERKGIQTFIDLEDYLPGVMICQIDGDDEMEALKCQAVIARTYIYRLMDGRTEINEEELDMDYLGEGEGGLAEDRERLFRGLERCRKAAEATRGVVMMYEGRCILPLFHAMSGGRTRTGEADFPYLQSVESAADTRSSDYLQIMEWSKAEFARRISQISTAGEVSPDQLPEQIQTLKKDDAGYMLEIKIGAGTYSGEDVQYALNLPSPCFSLEGRGDQIRARVKGRGHGYGLSQVGAENMAKEGWGYEDILNHYYKNISLIFE